MAIARIKTWASGDTLTAADLNSEFNNILNNGTPVAFPLTTDVAAAGFDLTEVDELGFATTAATVASAAGRMRRNGTSLTWHDGVSAQALMLLGNNYIGGLELTNSATDATNDIIFATGAATDATNSALMRLTAALDKQLDSAWAVGAATGGLDTGTVAGNGTAATTYHLHLIKRTDTGVVDALFSTSVNAPTMPANYTLRRRVGSVMRGTVIFPFVQYDDQFHLQTIILDVTATNETTAAITRTLSIPTGINAIAEGTVHILASASTGCLLISDLAATDQAPVFVSATGSLLAAVAASQIGAYFRCRTNTSAQVRSRRQTTGAGEITRISTRGWIDVRGKNGGV